MPKNLVSLIKSDLKSVARPEKVEFMSKFFRTRPGEYAEGDIIISVSVPDQRKIAKKYWQDSSLDDVDELLNSPIHEHRLTALIILTLQMDKSLKSQNTTKAKTIYDFYLNHTDRVNNWDLVDVSAYKIVGAWLLTQRGEMPVLTKLATSKKLWENRIAMVATWAFIRQKQLEPTIKIATLLLDHPHDLIHKAVGWMLREAGKRDEKVLKSFLDKHYQKMPRTMLRYATELLSESEQRHYLGPKKSRK